MSGAVGKSRGGKNSEINVTPLVDVVLVLLIIFMVISPGNSMFVPNPIPKPADIEDTVVTSEQLVLELLSDGTVLLNRSAVTRSEFTDVFRKLMQTRTDKKLYVAVADEVPYGEVMNWMSQATTLGASMVALQIKKPEEQVAPSQAPAVPLPTAPVPPQ